MNRARLIRILVCMAAGIVLAAVLAYGQMAGKALRPNNDVFEKQPYGGSFTGLLDQDGEIQKPDSFHDKYQLVFFGFTHCPSICPGELQKITTLMRQLTPEQRERLAPIFVTVDPARDTPEVMKAYLGMFDPGITALTGKQEDVARVLADWKVYAGKVATEDGGYTMDHSAFLYLRDPQGWLVDLFQLSDPVEDVAAGVTRAIGK